MRVSMKSFYIPIIIMPYIMYPDDFILSVSAVD